MPTKTTAWHATHSLEKLIGPAPKHWGDLHRLTEVAIMAAEDNAMSTSTPSDSEAFYDFFGRSLQDGGRELPPEAILRKWRAEKEFEESCEAIREGLADIEAGRVVPFEDVAAELRRKYGIAER